MRVMLTGGAGYIGSHTLLECLAQGHETLVVDSFANSSVRVIKRLKELTNSHFDWVKCDIRDCPRLTKLTRAFRPNVVIHFAGLKSISESLHSAVDYYDVNVSGTVSLLRAIDAADCSALVFSSSATVYGDPRYLPVDEAHPILPTNVYGQTKAMAEQVLTDWASQRDGRSAILLRYFNPVGAHPSARIGEDPRGVPDNLMPFLAQVATGQLPTLRIWGNNYPTRDGTGIRDYVHVVDVACAHVAAIERARKGLGAEAFNIGTGQGTSVLEIMGAFESVLGRPLPYEVHPRRLGDVAEAYADTSLATRVLNWQTKLDLQEIVRSLWAWQLENPNGYT